jgi:hypothetical protein
MLKNPWSSILISVSTDQCVSDYVFVSVRRFATAFHARQHLGGELFESVP